MQMMPFEKRQEIIIKQLNKFSVWHYMSLDFKDAWLTAKRIFWKLFGKAVFQDSVITSAMEIAEDELEMVQGYSTVMKFGRTVEQYLEEKLSPGQVVRNEQLVSRPPGASNLIFLKYFEPEFRTYFIGHDGLVQVRLREVPSKYFMEVVRPGLTEIAQKHSRSISVKYTPEGRRDITFVPVKTKGEAE